MNRSIRRMDIPLIDATNGIESINLLKTNRMALILLEKRLNEIDWYGLYNNGIVYRSQIQELLMKEEEKFKNELWFGEKINQNLLWFGWEIFSRMPNAVPLLERNQSKICWRSISSNPKAIDLISKNLDKIDWDDLSLNPNAVPILAQHLDKVNWIRLSLNPNAVVLLAQNLDKINWYNLSYNKNPDALKIIECNLDKPLCWLGISQNPNAIYIIEKNMDKINWIGLSCNHNAVRILEQYPDKVSLTNLYYNKTPDAVILLQKLIHAKNNGKRSASPDENVSNRKSIKIN